MATLKEYDRKRDFKKTAEPKGKLEKKSKNRFVIQKHEASHLHYDFRLELDGTLKSWAVPKGPPQKKGEKRLAMEVEDHPVAYIDFEGTIPQGQYGGGTVMVWDFGTFEPLSKNPTKELASGKLHVILHGKKLNGEWYLVRLRNKNQWLLVKGGEDLKAISKKADDTSAVSGRSMKQIAAGNNVWNSNREEKTSTVRGKVKTRAVAKTTDTKKKPIKRDPLPTFIEPMKAKLIDKPLPGEWIYEIKFDGFRALAFKNKSGVKLLSRNNKEFDKKFPTVGKAAALLDAESAVIDGEIVALDSKGKSSFQLLQAYDLGTEKPPLIFYAFDLLYLDGKDLKNEPVTSRKDKLKELLKGNEEIIRFSESLEGEVKKLLKVADKLGLEGLIGKRVDSNYEAGKRSGAWIKLKLNHEQEMVIGGYSEPTGARKGFGALILGYYKNKKFVCAGKVGTGFNDAVLKLLFTRLSKLAVKGCPFDNLPESSAGRHGSGITASQMRKCHWVKPTLVCQVKFTEWTSDGKLRHPVFLGMREDKSAKEVVRETAK